MRESRNRAEHQREMVKNESAREARMMAKLTEMNEEFDKVKGENKTAVRQVILDKSGKLLQDIPLHIELCALSRLDAS